jgi:hypothetical protein
MSGNQLEEEELESAQKNQKNVGNAAASNPETSGPTENLRDKAARPIISTAIFLVNHHTLLDSTFYSSFCYENRNIGIWRCRP